MRILHLISSVGLFGAERVAVELSKSLKKTYHCEPILGIIRNAYNPHEEISEEADRNDIPYALFACRSQLDLKLVFTVRKFIKTNGVDIIHCHGYKSNFYGLLASKGRVPSVTTNHNWLTAHWKLKTYCFLDSLWIRFFDRIVAVSNEVKKDMLKYKIPEEKIRVIDNGISLDRFEKRVETTKLKTQLGLGEKTRVIGTIGSLVIEKGHIYLLEAARQILDVVKDLKFLIVGDGPLRKALEEKSEELGIKKDVIFMGQRKDVPELLTVMDIFVLPSIKEGLPVALLEAMAAKRPIVATRVGAIPRVIESEDIGILVEPKDISGLREALAGLIDDPGRMNLLARGGFDRVSMDFSSDGMCKHYLKLYNEITRSHPLPDNVLS
ncbi:MAG: glycosyl transferase, family [Deltaproteobacteria bacterium]|jgi:glycosyltransferase involved in cell wall biosynthesis|nr:glycosyl transferase, family [Deltaproteobacteria bacterium]